MASAEWKLPKSFLKGLDRTQDSISSMVDHLRMKFEDMDEDWQGSEEGEEVDAFIEKLNEAYNVLVEIAEEP